MKAITHDAPTGRMRPNVLANARRTFALLALSLALALVAGCTNGPRMLPVDQQRPIDRRLVEYPAGLSLVPYIEHLTAPTAAAFDTDPNSAHYGTLVIAENGLGNAMPRVVAFKPDGTFSVIYPTRNYVLDLGGEEKLYGPIGGLAVYGNEIFVTHRDRMGRGMVSAVTWDGLKRTVVGDLPAAGDHGVTDIVVRPSDGRLFFGVGSATNSGVVGLDNWQAGWVKKHPNFSDVPWVDLKLTGPKFITPNPRGGILGGDERAVTGPYQKFGTSDQLRIRAAANGRPTAAIYSVNKDGGDLTVDAHGIRYPAGLAFNEYGRLYATNQGMENRGTRPVRDDPDVVVAVPEGSRTWYGWPDYAANGLPISEPRFQPPVEKIIPYGYPELAPLIDQNASGTDGLKVFPRNSLLAGEFPALSGATGIVAVPPQGPMSQYANELIVALSGDRAPWSNGGEKLVGPQGFRVVRVSPDTKQTRDFVFNPATTPASRIKGKPVALERPVDVVFGPDGSLYILDLGVMEMRDGNPRVTKGTGRVFKLTSEIPPATQRAPQPPAQTLPQ